MQSLRRYLFDWNDIYLTGMTSIRPEWHLSDRNDIYPDHSSGIIIACCQILWWLQMVRYPAINHEIYINSYALTMWWPIATSFQKDMKSCLFDLHPSGRRGVVLSSLPTHHVDITSLNFISIVTPNAYRLKPERDIRQSATMAFPHLGKYLSDFVQWEGKTHVLSYFRSSTVNMGHNQWVLPSFKQILIDASDEYVANTDKTKGKPRTVLIERVAEEIRQAVDGTNDKLPDDLHKVWLVLLYSCTTYCQYPRLSVHGLETRLQDMPKETAERSQRSIHVVIRHQSGLGLRRPYVESSMQQRFPKYK